MTVDVAFGDEQKQRQWNAFLENVAVQPGSLAEVINAAIAGKARMDHMKEFFEGVGHGDTAGVWEGDPNLRPDFRAQHQKKLDKQARAAKAQEMI